MQANVSQDGSGLEPYSNTGDKDPSEIHRVCADQNTRVDIVQKQLRKPHEGNQFQRGDIA